jgi:hypothetical protein
LLLFFKKEVLTSLSKKFLQQVAPVPPERQQQPASNRQARAGEISAGLDTRAWFER